MLSNFIRKVLLALLGGIPSLALAERLDPGGGKNAWDYFVYGNGPAIVEILTSLKLLLAPDHGEPVFKYIMLFLAVIGFVVLAARAGFNPQQNFLRMFSFLLVVWFVNYATTGLKANVNVLDRLNGYSHVVTGVPAIVALPAAIVSQTGEWLSRQIEQNFSIPGELTMTGGGGFDLMGRVMSDANKVMFTDDNLKRTVSSYISNCAIPAMAMGRITVNDLTKGNNLMATLANARHNAITTIYFPAEGRADLCGFMAEDLGMGGVDSCENVYRCMVEDLEAHGNALVDAGNEAWEKTGVFIPLETALSTALSMSGSDAGPFAGYGRPQGYILQRAMISHMGGSFRNAAVMTGNSELMMATSVAQAEQSQRTSWAVAADIFNNMMGYVYVVLQAFILAIVPIVIISLMIPGLGAKVFVNYGQILIWLTLWSPMLAIINFLMTLFWQQQMNAVGLANGLDMYNAGLMTAQTANLQIASQFLGTMVPILTWGLVKGSMAFTEFISSGIGSSFATQAGAQGATGNISMGNLSMDNVGMNKYNTAMSASVGFQATDGFFGAGVGNQHMQGGGASAYRYNQAVTSTSKAGMTSSDGKSLSDIIKESKSLTESASASFEERASNAERMARAYALVAAHRVSSGNTEAAGTGESAARDTSINAEKGTGRKDSEGSATQLTTAVEASGGLSASVGPRGAKQQAKDAQAGNKPSAATAAMEALAQFLPGKASADVSLDLSASARNIQTASTSTEVAAKTTGAEGAKAQDSTDYKETFNKNASAEKAFQDAVDQTRTLSVDELTALSRQYSEQAQAAREASAAIQSSYNSSFGEDIGVPKMVHLADQKAIDRYINERKEWADSLRELVNEEKDRLDANFGTMQRKVDGAQAKAKSDVDGMRPELRTGIDNYEVQKIMNETGGSYEEAVQIFGERKDQAQRQGEAIKVVKEIHDLIVDKGLDSLNLNVLSAVLDKGTGGRLGREFGFNDEDLPHTAAEKVVSSFNTFLKENDGNISKDQLEILRGTAEALGTNRGTATEKLKELLN